MRMLISLFFMSVVTFVMSTATYADAYRCVGLDGEGNKINVLYDEKTNTVNINGTILKVEAGTQGKNGVATENYETEDGEEVYASLVVEGHDKIILRQMRAKDDSAIATVPLACD